MAAHRLSRHRRKAKHLDSSAKHSHNILTIYRSAGIADHLYTVQTFAGQTLPILHDNEIPPIGRIDATTEDDPVVLDDLDANPFPVDERLIKSKIARGARIWDGPAVYLKGMQTDSTGKPILTAGICNYYGYVTLAQQLSTEANSSTGRKPIPLGHFGRFSDATSGKFGPVTLAATVTCVFDSEHGEQFIALQRRSDAVVNAAGMYGVAPIFGLESNRLRSAKSRYGTIYYNFLKEFIEEFFDLEPVIRAATTPRSDLDWIFQLPHAPDLVAQLDNGDLSLFCTGLGIDLSDGSLTIALTAHFTSPDYLETLRSTAVGSWESETATATRPAIEFVAVDDPSLADLATIEHMDPSSIFSLDLARQHLKRTRGQSAT